MAKINREILKSSVSSVILSRLEEIWNETDSRNEMQDLLEDGWCVTGNALLSSLQSKSKEVSQLILIWEHGYDSKYISLNSTGGNSNLHLDVVRGSAEKYVIDNNEHYWFYARLRKNGTYAYILASPSSLEVVETM